MELTKLNEYNALSTPAEAWVIPDIESSKWTREIDYYINFQITKSLDRNLTHPALLISPNNNLPADKIIYLHNSKSKEEWIKKAYEIWKGLGFPTIKIFLPSGVQIQDITSNWQLPVEKKSFYFVEEHS